VVVDWCTARIDAQTCKDNQTIVQDHTSLKENAEHPTPQGWCKM
jgi:hypothetical protein